MQTNRNPESAPKLEFIPLHLLNVSPLNVRANDTSDVSELRALIRSQGLLQNLAVVMDADGAYGVVGGGRRLRAMRAEAQEGLLEPDYPVPCCIVDEVSATAVSIAENSGREPMSPADEFLAFKKLTDDGMPIEDIAARFGLAPIVVRRRLELAKVSPKLIALYRAGEMKLDQLQAFTLTSSIKLQEQVAANPHELSQPGSQGSDRRRAEGRGLRRGAAREGREAEKR